MSEFDVGTDAKENVDKPEISTVRLWKLSRQEKVALAKTIAGLPAELGMVEVDGDRPVPYKAGVEEIDGGENGERGRGGLVVVYLSGILAGYEQNGHVAAAIGEELAETEKEGVVAVSMGSSISDETNGSRYMTDPVERSLYLLAAIGKVLEEKGGDRMVVVAHSMGALEAAIALANCEEYFGEMGFQTKLEGLVLAQPLGVFKQSFSELIDGAMRVGSVKDEVETLIPSFESLVRLRDELDEAKELGDRGWEMRVKRKLEPLEKRFQKIKSGKEDVEIGGLVDEKMLKSWGFSADEMLEIDKMDSDIWRLWTGGEFADARRLMNKRFKKLKPVVDKAVVRAGSQGSMGALIRALVYLGSHPKRMTELIPEGVRQMYKIPIGIVTGDNDAYFPSKRADERIWKNRFANAPRVVRGYLRSWAHASPAIEEKRFAQMVGKVVKIMGAEGEKEKGFEAGEVETQVNSGQDWVRVYE